MALRSLHAAFLVALAVAGLIGSATGTAAPDAKPTRPPRVPWDASRVMGFPGPPPPYHVVRTFHRLQVVFPIAVAHQPGSDRLLLVQQMQAWSGHGRVLRIKDDPDADSSELLLTLDGIAYGLAFHPDFAKNGYLYIGDNGPMTGKKKTRVTRYTMDPKPPYRLDPMSARVIIEWDSDGHNGGDVAFGNDGMLYVTSGDGTSDSDTNHAGQDLGKLLSKVLRIDVDHPDPDRMYAVPKDNPFIGKAGIRPETWAYGLRNPWRIHIDRKTGDIWVGQNGQDLWEQVYLVQRGANYGWSAYEGSHPFYVQRLSGPSPLSLPIAEHPHSEMRSLTGGVVYYGDRLPELRGAYIYGDWSTGKIFGIKQERGRVIWHKELATTTLQITGFGLDSRGELLIADHGGGAYYRLEPAPRNEQPARFPTKLSETGLFLSVPEHRPHPALIPYSVNTPLWSDGADKERFMALPGLTQIEFTAAHGWNFPEGTVLVKTFSLDTADRGKRPIETRLLTRQQGQWYGYSYLWNRDQTDAELVAADGTDRDYQVRGGRKQTWHYPSRVECMVCHSRAANFVLGPSLLQMNRGDQLQRLEELGVFKAKPSWPQKPDEPRKLAGLHEAGADLEARARSYLHANCAQCHVPAGGGNAQIDLEITTSRQKMNLIGAKPLHDTFGIKDAKLIAPGDPERSLLYQRLKRRGPGQMPPLATSIVDEDALRVIRQWIESLKD